MVRLLAGEIPEWKWGQSSALLDIQKGPNFKMV